MQNGPGHENLASDLGGWMTSVPFDPALVERFGRVMREKLHQRLRAFPEGLPDRLKIEHDGYLRNSS